MSIEIQLEIPKKERIFCLKKKKITMFLEHQKTAFKDFYLKKNDS